MQPIKLLFLDIDGVLNNRDTEERFKGFIGINPTLVKRLNHIVDKTQCKIVLSSTWRLDEDFRAEVRANGIDFMDITGRYNGKGGESTKFGFRGEEVRAWLRNRTEDNVVKYAILDDDGDFYKDQPLFQTHTHIGLTDRIANQVIEYLNN